MKGYKTTPENINRIIDKLRDLWLKHPHQRFGQLLCNYILFKGTSSLNSQQWVFNQFDEITEENIDQALNFK